MRPEDAAPFPQEASEHAPRSEALYLIFNFQWNWV
jgi:hypothetical protein